MSSLEGDIKYLQRTSTWKAGVPTKGTEVGTVTLWGYYMSSCTWRVRLALGLKGIPYEYKALNISNGEHKSEEFKKISPLQYVPAVEVDGVAIADSMAIIMYFEEKFPDKRPLLPVDLVAKATVRQLLKKIAGKYTVGDELTLADVYLVPQIGKARERFKVDLTPYPSIERIGKGLLELPKVQASLPANQPDTPK